MKKYLFRFFILLFLFVCFVPVNADNTNFKEYVNARYGFKITFPDIFNVSRESPNGDGITLLNPEKKEFESPSSRRAVSYLIDKKDLANEYDGIEAYSFLTSSMSGFVKKNFSYNTDDINSFISSSVVVCLSSGLSFCLSLSSPQML